MEWLWSVLWILVFTGSTLTLLYLLYKKAIYYAEVKFSILVSISKIFRQDLPLRKIFPEVLGIVVASLPSVRCGAVIIFSSKSDYKIQACEGVNEIDFKKLRIPENILQQVRQKKCGIQWKGPHKLNNTTYTATLCPLLVQKTVVGAIVLLHKKKHLARADMSFVHTMLNHISLEFEDRLLQTKLDAFSKGLSMVEYSYEKIVDNLPTGIIAIDPSGNILLWNKVMHDITGKTVDDVVGTAYLDVFDNASAIQRFYNELKQTNLISYIKEFNFRKKPANKSILLSIVGYPLFDRQNSVIAYVIMHRDITQEKKLQDELKQTQERVNRELTEKVHIATKELQDANQELVRLNKIKSEFVSTISHELKTPLTSIKGYIALLLAGKMGDVNDKQKSALDIVHEQSDRLNDLIADVLDLSRLESGKTTLKLERVYLHKVLDSVVEVMMPQAKQKNIAIQKNYDDTVSLTADERKLHQTFLNLVSNAVKFTPDNGTITLTVTDHEQTCVINVADTGIGIEQENLQSLFEPFYQVEDHMTRNVSGTGLGLTIVKRIVELHKGTIDVQSIPEKGTTFSITLPKQH